MHSTECSKAEYKTIPHGLILSFTPSMTPLEYNQIEVNFGWFTELNYKPNTKSTLHPWHPLLCPWSINLMIYNKIMLITRTHSAEIESFNGRFSGMHPWTKNGIKKSYHFALSNRAKIEKKNQIQKNLKKAVKNIFDNNFLLYGRKLSLKWYLFWEYRHKMKITFSQRKAYILCISYQMSTFNAI